MLANINLQSILLSVLAIASETKQEQELANWIEDKWKNHACFTMYREGNSLVYCTKVDDTKPTIALYGHIDTVPSQQDKEPHITNEGKIFGCGASDMKAGIAIMLALMEATPFLTWQYNLQFIFYDKEEGPYIENGLGPVLEKFSFLKQANIAFVLEPTQNEIQTGCVGAINLLLTWHGKRAHAARPWEGHNAIHCSGALLEYLLKEPAKQVVCDSLSFFETKQITQAKTDNSRNVVPNSFTVNLNYRFTPDKTQEQAQNDIITFLAKHMLPETIEATQLSQTQYTLGSKASIEIIDLAPAAPVVTQEPSLQKFIAQHQLTIAPKQAWTDIARLALFNIKAVNFGPGLPSQAHQKNEYVYIQDIEQNYHYFLSFLQ